MPRSIPEEDLRAIENAVRGQQGGLSARQIASRLPSRLPHRTLQFRLKRLVEEGRLAMRGVRRGAKYRLPPIASGTALAEIPIPLAEQSARLVEHFEEPPQARTPAGYERSFLDSYRPNSSAYLDLGTRIELRKAERPRTGPHPAGTFARRILQRLLIDLSWNSSRLEVRCQVCPRVRATSVGYTKRAPTAGPQSPSCPSPQTHGSRPRSQSYGPESY